MLTAYVEISIVLSIYGPTVFSLNPIRLSSEQGRQIGSHWAQLGKARAFSLINTTLRNNVW